MHITPQPPLQDILLFDSGILIDEEVLVIADIHLGFEESIAPDGLLGSVDTNKKIVQKMESLIERYDPSTLIINGDLKHEFTVLPQHIYRWLKRFLIQHAQKREIIVIPGNHDASIIPFLNDMPVTIKPYHIYKGACICHGDQLFQELVEDPKITTFIVGHQHPAIALRSGVRSETYKCFLYGQSNQKDVLLLPCFHPLRTGTDVTQDKTITPYAHDRDLDAYRVFVVEGEVFDFKTIKEIKKINR